MLSEITSSLNQYYLKTPSYLRNDRKNLAIIPNQNNNVQINDQYHNNSENLLNNNYNNNIKSKKIQSAKNKILPNNALGANFTFKSSDIFTPSSLNKKPNVNNLYNNNNNYNDKKIRPKSAAKGSVNINNNINKNTKKSLTNNFKIIDDDYDLNSNMNKFENLINIIDKNGFQKYQDEINDKKILISQIENSISILKNKISLSKNNIYNKFHKETKNKIKYENMLSVGYRYKNVGKNANAFKNEIDVLKNKIALLNDETLKMKTISFKRQNEIDEINNEIKKGNKAISDRQKQIENILAAIQLLKKHIIAVKQKIGRIKNIKYNYIDQLNYIESNI